MATSSTPVRIDFCSIGSSSSSTEDNSEVSDDGVESEELNPMPSMKAKKQSGAGLYKTKDGQRSIHLSGNCTSLQAAISGMHEERSICVGN